MTEPAPPSARRCVFEFEDLGSDLPRPPLAAIRLFWASGVRVSLQSWLDLNAEIRWAIATEGARDEVSSVVAQALISHIPLREIALTAKSLPDEAVPTPGLRESLGMPLDWATTTWPTLRPFDRFVLNYLRNNTRLLWRAYEEISGTNKPHRSTTWSGLLARAEVRVRTKGEVRKDLMNLLATEKLLEGRALILARTSGLRAARRARETFDLYADVSTGTVELDWNVRVPQGVVVWQAHVSDHHGHFFAAGSLIAATTAALCLYDMIKEFDPTASVENASVLEEEWSVGKYDWDDTTKKFASPFGNVTHLK